MKGSIYVIRSHQTEDVYYGSTIQLLCKRMASHRKEYQKWKKGTRAYTSSYEILKYGDAYIELVEEVFFENKHELRAREGHHIRTNKCVNKVIPCRTKEEYDKMYYEKNKESMSEKHKLYYQKVKHTNHAHDDDQHTTHHHSS